MVMNLYILTLDKSTCTLKSPPNLDFTWESDSQAQGLPAAFCKSILRLAGGHEEALPWEAGASSRDPTGIGNIWETGNSGPHCVASHGPPQCLQLSNSKQEVEYPCRMEKCHAKTADLVLAFPEGVWHGDKTVLFHIFWIFHGFWRKKKGLYQTRTEPVLNPL